MMPNTSGASELIDLDANATTPLLPAAREAMFALDGIGNPASGHALGRRARKHLEDARERIAHLLGAQPDEVIFTSGATESNNLAIFGLATGPVLASPIEHPCVTEPLKKLTSESTWMPVGGDGMVRFDESQMNPSLTFVAVQMVNHETGAIQPVREIAARLPKAVRLHTDAAQAVGKIPVNFRELGATSLAASAHKFRGPAGIGLLLLRRGTPLRSQIFGGHQQQGRRPGTESVLLAVGMAVALDHAARHREEHHAKLILLRERFLDRLTSHELTFVLNSPPDAFPGCLNISFPGCRGDLSMMALDLAGVACSTGSACSSGSLLPSPVLQAMGVPDDLLRSAIRFSFGPELDLETMSEAADRVVKVMKKLHGG